MNAGARWLLNIDREPMSDPRLRAAHDPFGPDSCDRRTHQVRRILCYLLDDSRRGSRLFSSATTPLKSRATSPRGMRKCPSSKRASKPPDGHAWLDFQLIRVALRRERAYARASHFMHASVSNDSIACGHDGHVHDSIPSAQTRQRLLWTASALQSVSTGCRRSSAAQPPPPARPPRRHGGQCAKRRPQSWSSSGPSPPQTAAAAP